MFNFKVDDILQTINMIKMHHLDIRTVTLSLSLRDCISTDVNETSQKIYDKITNYAKNLANYAQQVEEEYSIPIVNKRIAVTPISLIGESAKNPDYVLLAKTLDEAAKAEQAALEEQKAKMENSAPLPQDPGPQTPADQWKQNVSNFANTPQNLGANTKSAPVNSPQDAGLPTPPSTQLPPKTSPNMKVANQNVTFKWKVN